MYKEFKLVRVDDRLIHAQIILIWLKRLNINHIIIVDNEVASNPFLSQVYKLTTPPSLHIEIFSEQMMIEYCNRLNEKGTEVKRSLVIMKHLQTVVTLAMAGVIFDAIQMSESSDSASKKMYLKEKYNEELKVLEQLQILVYYQRGPDDNKDFLNFLDKTVRKKGNSYKSYQ